MKTILTATLFLLLTLVFSTTTISFAQQTPTATTPGAIYKLTVTIPNVSSRSGKLYIGLANDQPSFDGVSIKSQTVDVPATGPVTIAFDGLTPGRYAVRVYQDLNGNGKMDFSGQMPTEPFGFSNVTMLMGPPTFDQCSVDLAENKSIEIGMMSMN